MSEFNLAERLPKLFANKTVWLSGHTGFKGSWLTEWLLMLGAHVVGFSQPPTEPSLFSQLRLESRIQHQIGDINDSIEVEKSILSAQPHFIFHLAAQPIVRTSYREPVRTFETNLMGTVNVLEALRLLHQMSPFIAVFVTTDKVYENLETYQAYRETDALGGHDPYSASKAAAEIAIHSYRRSYHLPIASARAGNVIGGGDWADDRIVPDAIRSLKAGLPIPVRNPISTRPWQHVLEPLSGYLTLAAQMADVPPGGNLLPLTGAFNFGPNHGSNRTVKQLVEEIVKNWGSGAWTHLYDPYAVHEAGQLRLAHEKAFHFLGWTPRWEFSTTIAQTVGWYRQSFDKPDSLPEFTRAQITDYTHANRNSAS